MCFKTISEHACVQILRKKTVKLGFLKILTLADFHHRFGLFWLRRKGQISVKSQHDNGSVLAVELLRLVEIQCVQCGCLNPITSGYPN